MGIWNRFKFWINEGGIANLFSVLRLEADRWDLDYTNGSWIAVTPGSAVVNFLLDRGVCNGMPYIDMTRPEDFITPAVDGVAMIKTVRNNYEGFTKEQIKQATAARNAMAMMAHPRDDKLKHVVSTNIVQNCTFNSSDLTNATALFGPDRGSIGSKTIRRRPDKVRPEYASIPWNCLKKYRR